MPVIYSVEFMVAVSSTFSLHALLQGGNQPHIHNTTTMLLYCTTISYTSLLLSYYISLYFEGQLMVGFTMVIS